MDYFAGHTIIGLLDECYELLRYSIMGQELPQGVSVYTVKGLLVVYEVHIEWRVPF